MRVPLTLLAIAAGFIGCTHSQAARVAGSTASLEASVTFDWKLGSAVEFLDVLKAHHRPGETASIYSVDGLHHDWLRDADVEALIQRIESDTPCAYVVSTYSSHLPRGHSTEGHEAAFLLEGYRRRYFPPELSSDRYQPNLKELKRWYRVWRTRNE